MIRLATPAILALPVAQAQIAIPAGDNKPGLVDGVPYREQPAGPPARIPLPAGPAAMAVAPR